MQYHAELGLAGCALLVLIYSLFGRKKNDRLAFGYAKELVKAESPLRDGFGIVDSRIVQLSLGN